MDYHFGSAVPLLVPPPVDIDGNLVAAPVIAVTVQEPGGTLDGPFTPTYDSTLDRYVTVYTPTVTGLHTWRAVEATFPQLAVEGTFYVFPAYSQESDAWAPSLAEVAALVPTRTVDTSGTQRGTFTADTTPTEEQVTGYIAQIVGEIVGTVGEIPSSVFAQAKGVATLGVAWLVERSYPPTADVQNVANDLVADYRVSLGLLKASAQAAGRGGSRVVSVPLSTWPRGSTEPLTDRTVW